MASMVTNLFKVKDLRERVLFTIGCLIVYRIGAHIPVPGIDPTGLAEYFESQRSTALGGLLGMVDLFSGGAFERFTILSLGIMPYISASIILQLLTTVIPHLEQLQKEGEMGRKKIQQYTRYGTILICMVQATFISRWLGGQAGVLSEDMVGNSMFFSLLTVVTITTGSVFLMWIGEQITERGIGNGISLIIFAGIAARIPAEFWNTFQKVQNGEFEFVAFVLLVLIIAAVVFFVVYEQSGQRRIPVQFAKRVVGRKMMGAQSTYIPFKINPTGVIPIIFASAIMMVPAQLASMIGNRFPTFLDIAGWFSHGKWAYMGLYAILVILFAYVYTSIQFNPADIADNLKRQGGYVPGIRPGQHTQEFLTRVLNRITVAGSLFLAAIAIFPDLLLKVPLFDGMSPGFAYLMGGTSLLILVAVDLDTMKQIESQLVMREYDGFMGKRKKRKNRRN